MYRNDAARDCAESAGCADNSDCAIEPSFSTSTWISSEKRANTTPTLPIAAEILAEIDGRIDSLAGQLAALASPPSHSQVIARRQLEYLLEQFRILTFTVGGALSRQILTDACGIPASQLQWMLGNFVDVSNHLRSVLEEDRESVDEIQRQVQSISRRMAVVISRTLTRGL